MVKQIVQNDSKNSLYLIFDIFMGVLKSIFFISLWLMVAGIFIYLGNEKAAYFVIVFGKALLSLAFFIWIFAIVIVLLDLLKKQKIKQLEKKEEFLNDLARRLKEKCQKKRKSQLG